MSQRQKVLVVDDNPDVRDILSKALKKAGFDVETADDGAAGLQKALQDCPSVIVSDEMMPAVTGSEFLSALKKNNVVTRFIFMTGEAKSLGETVRFIKLGACDVIHKPFSPHEIVNRVNRALTLESALSTYVGEPAPLISSVLDEVEDIQRQRERIAKESRRLANERRSFSLAHGLIKAGYFIISTLCTIALASLRVVQPGTPLLVFSIFAFIMLVLPFDRITSLTAKMFKAEGGAVFQKDSPGAPADRKAHRSAEKR